MQDAETHAHAGGDGLVVGQGSSRELTGQSRHPGVCTSGMLESVCGMFFFLCPGRVGSGRIDSVSRKRRVDLTRFGSARFGSDRIGSTRFCSFRIDSVRTVQLGSDRLGSSRFGSTRFGSAGFRSTQFGSIRFDSVLLGSVRLCSDRLGPTRALVLVRVSCP